MDVKKKDVREKQLYRSTYQQIVPDEEVVERLLLMESTLENGGKRTMKKIKKIQVAAACIVCFCAIAGGTVYASQKGYFERIKGNTIFEDMMETDNEEIKEDMQEDMQVDETQIVSNGTYTFQLVSYYKEATMGNVLLEIMITRNDGKIITKKEVEDFEGDKYLAIELYGDGEDTIGYGAESKFEYDQNNNLIYSFCGCIELSEKSKKAENVKKIKITQRIYEEKMDEEGNKYVDIKNIGTMNLVQEPVILDTVEMKNLDNSKARKMVISPLGLQLTTTEDDATRNGAVRIYKKDGTASTIGTSTEKEYLLDDGKLLYILTFGKFLDLETIDYIELGGVKYKCQ